MVYFYYKLCYMLYICVWVAVWAHKSTDARRNYKITWSYRYSCESPEMHGKNQSLKEECIVFTDEQFVQAILKHPNACCHVTLSGMRSLSTHTRRAPVYLIHPEFLSVIIFLTFSYTLHFIILLGTGDCHKNAIFWARVWDFPLICHKSLNSRKEARTIPSSEAVL